MEGNSPAGSSYAGWSGSILPTTISAASSAAWASIHRWRSSSNTEQPENFASYFTVYLTGRSSYRPEFIADLAKQTTDRRERAKIARAAGYTVKFIEGMLRKRRDEEEPE